MKEEIPNIVIFIADEMRGDTISIDKKINPIIKTPNIDDLVKDGATFRNCFSVSPVCVPSRCCIFTGQYVHNGHRSLYQLLRPHEDNLFKILKKNGYEVTWIGRNDLFNKSAMASNLSKILKITKKLKKVKIKENPFPKDHPMRKSFYYGMREESYYDIDSAIIETAIEYLESQIREPFCLYIALNFPHPPYTVEEPYFSMYDRAEIPAPIPPKIDDKPESMRLMYSRYGLDKLSKDDFREIIATYYGMITRVDTQFGQILKKLKEIGKYKSTSIFFFSDHGDYAGDYGLTEKWPNNFQDCLINIPLVVKIPGIIPKNKVFTQLVESIDIFPTILEISKVKTRYTHFGKSLIPLLKGKEQTHREFVFAEGGYNLNEPQCFEDVVKSPELPLIGIYYDKTNIPLEKPLTVARSAMIRTQEWKLIIRNEGKEELYNLKVNPQELDNLIDNAKYYQIIQDLKEKLLKWYLNTSDNPHWERKRYI
ncbi:MAG: sulfatase-like hydrolase/transferase [Candidatus Helarchaeota archaeon]